MDPAGPGGGHESSAAAAAVAVCFLSAASVFSRRCGTVMMHAESAAFIRNPEQSPKHASQQPHPPGCWAPTTLQRKLPSHCCCGGPRPRPGRGLTSRTRQTSCVLAVTASLSSDWFTWSPRRLASGASNILSRAGTKPPSLVTGNHGDTAPLTFVVVYVQVVGRGEDGDERREAGGLALPVHAVSAHNKQKGQDANG